MAAEEKSNGDGTKNGENPNGKNSEFENFQQLLNHVLSVPKEEIDEKRRKEKRGKRAG